MHVLFCVTSTNVRTKRLKQLDGTLLHTAHSGMHEDITCVFLLVLVTIDIIFHIFIQRQKHTRRKA